MTNPIGAEQVYLWGYHRIRGTWERLQGPFDTVTAEQYKPYFEKTTLSQFYANTPHSGFATDQRPVYSSFAIARKAPKAKRNPSKPTIYQALVSKLGRTPTNAEVKADVERIKREALVELANKGKLPHQRKGRKNPDPEILVYGLPAGETERYMEVLLSSHSKSKEDVERVKAAASKDGWHSFRVTTFDGSPPDFTKVFGRRGKKNPRAASDDMFESFHGEESDETIEYQNEEHYHSNLAALGTLVELKVKLVTGGTAVIGFEDSGEEENANPKGVRDMRKSTKNPFWPFNSFTKTVIYHVGSGEKYTAKGTHSGYTVYQDNKSGNFLVPKLDSESRFDTKKDATKFIDHWKKHSNPNRQYAIRSEGSRDWRVYTITPSGSWGEAVSLHETKAAAKAAMNKLYRDNPKRKHGPFHEAGAVLGKITGGAAKPLDQFTSAVGKVGGYLDDQLGRVLNPRDSGPVYLTSNEEGTQLYIIGGDQSLDLPALGITGHEAEKELITIGLIKNVCYHARKTFDGKTEEFDYVHKLGEDGGELPTLIYDRINKQLKFSGGSYFIKRPLSGTSPGLEN